MKRCPIHGLPGVIAGPRKPGCTCKRFPLAEERTANRWAAFTHDELFGLYSIITGRGYPLDPSTPLAKMRDECAVELERRRS